MLIVPAILENNKKDFLYQVGRLLPHFSLIQIDVQDGLYVPSTTIPLQVVADCLPSLIESQKDKLGRIYFDFHLMLSDYSEASKIIESMSGDINIRYVFVHKNISDSPQSFPTLCPTINPEDSELLGKKARFLDDGMFSYPAIQIMTISPGPQGQEIGYQNIEKIKTLRKNGYKGEILIDGSVNSTSVKRILEMGNDFWPDTLCVGSYLTKSPNGELAKRIKVLNKLLEGQK